MSETGGRADKDGNEYENQQFAKHLLELVMGQATRIVAEPVKPDGVEYRVERLDGSMDYYQCKDGNGGKSEWSVSDLKSKKIFSHILRIIDGYPNVRYHFLSPLSYRRFDELCERARRNESAEEWVKYQLTTEEIRTAFRNCAKEFNLNPDDPQDQKRLRFLLSRCYFERMPFSYTATQELENLIGALFTGDTHTLRAKLEGFANIDGIYGIPITARDVANDCTKAGFLLRRDLGFGKTQDRIDTLNQIYWPECPWINGTPLPRKASEEALREIEAGRSVILHGKAGVGKSGCLQEILNSLKEKGVLYLSVKLDKLVPQKSAEQFGKDLGLPESPIYALSHLAGGKPCVLILDQLDALRWTSPHSGVALDVCKEMISQAETVNGHMGGKLSIVFATRTFDLEQDSGLQNLFDEHHGEKGENPLTWRKIQVNPFDKAEVVRVIGEEYRNFSPRLKTLLQTPSSLYVWTQIRKENRTDITSAGELMDAWWKQILNASGDLRRNICDCKDEIVRRMEKTASFSISLRLFSENEREINFLVSSGIMDKRGGSVSFVHQSFLDYFISQKLLEDVYDGKNLAELLPSREEQTPNIRYRLLTVLRELAETDQPTFTRQARNILSSPSVRYYLQCCVFEAAGQCEKPSRAVLALTREYAERPQWREYVLRTAYWGHLAFVKDFVSASATRLTDATLSLLRSVAVQDSAFVEAVLRSFMEGHPEKRRELWDALPYDCTEDGEKLFRLRMELLEENPDLLDKHIAFYHCIQNQSARAVDYLELILRNWEKRRFSDMYLGEESQLTGYAEANYRLITSRIFPLICELTREYHPNCLNWLSFYDNFEDWLVSSYQATFCRRTVALTGTALKKFAESEGKSFCSFLSGVSYPLSGIGHEIVMEGLSALSTEYSDFAVSWLLSGFREKAFVYSSGAQDFLYHTEVLIRRFSSHCSDELFERLEREICGWIDDKERVKRLFALRKGNAFPEYLPYWGGFQKTLLPCLDARRLSRRGRELLRDLRKNPYIHTPFYHGFSVGSAKIVVPPANSYAERLSDKTWLQIISTPNEKMKGRFRWREDGEYYVEASPGMFSRALGERAKAEPRRFAELSLSFPENCFAGYVEDVLSAIAEPANGKEQIPLELVAQVIRHFQSRNASGVKQEMMWILQRRPEEDWPDDILSLAENFALERVPSDADGYSFAGELQDASLNCVQGTALHAIAELLRAHPRYGERFRPTVEAACDDSNAAVRFAVMSCVSAYCDIDDTNLPFAVKLCEKLLSRDLRILAAHGSGRVLREIYEKKPERHYFIIESALASEWEDLTALSAGILCETAIYMRDDHMMDVILQRPFTERQQSKICQQAVRAFAYEDFRERSERILRRFMDSSCRDLALTQLFFGKLVSVKRDSAFLTALMGSKQGAILLGSFLRFLKESGEKIGAYTEILKAIGADMASNPDKWRNADWSNDFIRCVIRLLDESAGNAAAQAVCLDILDTLFQCCLYNIKPISDLIEDFETYRNA